MYVCINDTHSDNNNTINNGQVVVAEHAQRTPDVQVPGRAGRGQARPVILLLLLLLSIYFLLIL